MSKRLKVRVSHPVPARKEVVIIKLDGELDSQGAFQLDDQIQSVLKKGAKAIIMDLALITYISSVGLGTFLGLRNDLSEKKGDLILVGVQDKVERLFEMSGFLKLFKFSRDEGQALKELREF